MDAWGDALTADLGVMQDSLPRLRLDLDPLLLVLLHLRYARHTRHRCCPHFRTGDADSRLSTGRVGFLRATSSFLFSIASHGVWLFLTWVFWSVPSRRLLHPLEADPTLFRRLAGAAAITNALGGGLNCGSMRGFAHCNQLNAAEAFAWINWILATFAFVVVVVVGARSARRGDGFGGAVVV